MFKHVYLCVYIIILINFEFIFDNLIYFRFPENNFSDNSVKPSFRICPRFRSKKASQKILI